MIWVKYKKKHPIWYGVLILLNPKLNELSLNILFRHHKPIRVASKNVQNYIEAPDSRVCLERDN